MREKAPSIEDADSWEPEYPMLDVTGKDLRRLAIAKRRRRDPLRFQRQWDAFDKVKSPKPPVGIFARAPLASSDTEVDRPKSHSFRFKRGRFRNITCSICRMMLDPNYTRSTEIKASRMVRRIATKTCTAGKWYSL